MATTQNFIEYVCDQIQGIGTVRYRKMFGEYMVYLNEKPVLIVCDNTVFVKQLSELSDVMLEAETGYPYEGAKLHYVLDIDDADFSRKVVHIVESATPLPKPKTKKTKK